MNTAGIKERIKDFIQNTSRLTLTILGILILFIISAVIILISNAVRGSRKPAELFNPTAFSKEEEFIAPQNSNLTEDYYFSRTTKDLWTKEDAGQWFTQPSPSSMQELRKDNSSVVEDILGAAP